MENNTGSNLTEQQVENIQADIEQAAQHVNDKPCEHCTNCKGTTDE